ncbi:hypothetical protein D1605_008160 [Xylella fastidiosa subsp. fastidiosa]|uniref:hypothetical protein n=1 Tax=Xylella fastidiosa TaxID=2371 RepID=UPI0002E5499E|nr:hypothetical protein [Xylella fastidiosa]MBE0262239.1 hypothetical protein [Xylella fastidiosa subsp. fastidiosa]MBE0264371.1 hypothetical protein [Xylella fastidiosa subsp. fastidiosa]MBE0266525.1 hypothetical protein [Xylella fastidiosa subsp. fastidiosa]MBE0270996.1 hypothetical protein [Xylella fastidiosa subsp. fastidiosa]MBE0273308.1 hypothetical protein [Xylella fastidiosa subsp. fastidiosa]
MNADVAYMQLLLHWGIFCQEFRQAFEQCMLWESNCMLQRTSRSRGASVLSWATLSQIASYDASIV